MLQCLVLSSVLISNAYYSQKSFRFRIARFAGVLLLQEATKQPNISERIHRMSIQFKANAVEMYVLMSKSAGNRFCVVINHNHCHWQPAEIPNSCESVQNPSSHHVELEMQLLILEGVGIKRTLEGPLEGECTE